MTVYHFVALILAAIGPLLALARRGRAPESLVLFGTGLLAAFVPGLPPLSVDPRLVLTLFLPPLLYASAVRVSWHLLRLTFLPGVVLGAALVPATIGAVAAAGLTLIPELSWIGALLLGIIVSVFDTRLFHEAKGRPRVPRAVADVLKARELIARVVILASLSLATDVLRSGTLSVDVALDRFLLDIPAGILLGVVIGRIVVWARSRIDPAPVEIAVSISTPYAAALASEALQVSVVAAVITAALVVSAVRIDRQTGAPISSSETRVSATAFWEETNLILSSVLFFLAGRALPQALGALKTWSLWQLISGAAALLVVVLAVQFIFAFAASFLPGIAHALRSEHRPAGGRPAVAAVMAWASTRSVIGLLIALSIPATLPDGRPFAERDLILVLGALTIVGSVLLQGLTLRSVVRRAALCDESEETHEENEARQAIAEAFEAPQREHANGFDAARQALLVLREHNQIGDEVLVRMLRETDLHARAAEGSALPGAGPPNP